jgi:hypothetical protein
MYQIGELSDDEDPQMEWRRELLKSDGLETLMEDLTKWADHLAPKPQEHRSIRILGEMAAFLSQFDPENGIILVRQYANIALSWANAQRELMKETSEIANEFRAKECLMLGYSLLCFSTANIEMEDAAMLCKLIVRFYNGQRLTIGYSDAELQADIDAIRVPCQFVASKRFKDILPLVLSDANRTLTPAVRAIFTTAPKYLDWMQVHVENKLTTCFEAYGENNDHYIINIITGRLLLNGDPPGGLPGRILKHSLYIRSFGDRDFEVSSGAEVGVFKTTTTLNGYLYEFEDRGSKSIVMREIPCDDESCSAELISVSDADSATDSETAFEVDSAEADSDTEFEVDSAEADSDREWSSGKH